MLKSRLIYLGFLVFSIVLVMSKGGYVSTMFLYITLLVPMASFCMLCLTYFSFKVGHSIVKQHIVKGEEIEYSYQIYNNTIFVYCPMQVFFYGDKILFRDSVLSKPAAYILYPRKFVKVDTKLECNYRGCYSIGIEKIVINDYLNLFSLTFNDIEKSKITVYPLLREIINLKINKMQIEANESIASFDLIDASLFSDVRRYIPGDSLKNIHWKLTSKHNQLMSKVFEGNVNNRTKILLNTDQLSFTIEENIVLEEYIVESAVAIIRYLLINNTPVEMVWFYHEVKKAMAMKMQNFQGLYEILTLMTFCEHYFVEQVLSKELDEANNNNFIIITPYISESLSQLLIKKKRQNSALSVLIIDINNSEFVNCLKELPQKPLQELIAASINVYKIIFEKGMCRLEAL